MSKTKKVKEIESGWLGFLVMVAGASCRPEVLDEASKKLKDDDDTHYELEKDGLILLLDTIVKLCEIKRELGEELNPECEDCGSPLAVRRDITPCEDCDGKHDA